MALPDTFDGVATTTLTAHDANWVNSISGGSAVLDGSGNCQMATSLALYRYSGLGLVNQYAVITLDTQPYPGGPMVRMSGTSGGNNEKGYFGFLVSGGGTIRCYKRTPGANRQLGSDVSVSFSAGDTFEIRATGTGTVTLTLHKNGGAALLTTSDNGTGGDGAAHDSGDPGMYLNDSSFLVRTFDAGALASSGGGGAPFMGRTFNSLAMGGRVMHHHQNNQQWDEIARLAQHQRELKRIA